MIKGTIALSAVFSLAVSGVAEAEGTPSREAVPLASALALTNLVCRGWLEPAGYQAEFKVTCPDGENACSAAKTIVDMVTRARSKPALYTVSNISEGVDHSISISGVRNQVALPSGGVIGYTLVVLPEREGERAATFTETFTMIDESGEVLHSEPNTLSLSCQQI